MAAVRYILIVIELLGFIVFFFPVLADSVNVGNIFGMLLFLALLAVTLFYKPVFAAVSGFWGSGVLGKLCLSALALIAAAGIILAVVLSALMLKAQFNFPNSSATVVVLGCKVKNGGPSKMLRYRLNAAIEYLEEYPNAMCVVSGGKGKDEAISEAECMYDYLVSKGISEGRIFKEDKSENTEQNLKYSLEIISQNELDKRIAIVTDGFHEYRASVIAKKVGFDSVYAVPAHTETLYIPTYWVREWAALIGEWLK